MEIRSKQLLVFDWDGTLFDSMKGKTSSFSAVVSAYFEGRGSPIQSDLVAALYRMHSGKPRAEIFFEIAKVAGLQLDQIDFDRMSEELFAYNSKVLANASLFPDAQRLLDALKRRGMKFFISSSVPQAELEYFVNIVLKNSLRECVSGVLGSSKRHSKGREHIEFIRKLTGLQLEDILVIGDDEADYTLSNAAGVDCVLVDREDQFDGKFPSVVKNLDELWILLNLPVSTL